MDGVKVKISEKYKPPPVISLPKPLGNLLQDVVPSAESALLTDYGFELESNVLRKIDEWRRVRELEVSERQERMRVREDKRLRRIEEQQKQLLTQVSYPSAEDLSSDEEETATQLRPENSCGPLPIAAQVVTVKPQQTHQHFDTILMPTIVPDSNHSVSRSKNGDTGGNNFCKKENTIQTSKSWINFSDFENDNSSPFDNMELKTINDLDILAQVLQTTQINGNHGENNNNNNQMNNGNSKNNESEEATSSSKDVETTSPTTLPDHLGTTTNSPPEVINSYQYPASSWSTTTADPLPQFAAYQMHSTPNHNNNHIDFYNTAMQMYQYQPVNYYYPQQQPSNQIIKQHPISDSIQPAEPKAVSRLKSKSVPDIVNELNEEIRDSEQKRTRNNSQSVESSDVATTYVSSNPNNRRDDGRGSARYNNCDNGRAPKTTTKHHPIFESLGPESQQLALKISKMGFSIDVVAAVVKQLGNDDKQVR